MEEENLKSWIRKIFIENLQNGNGILYNTLAFTIRKLALIKEKNLKDSLDGYCAKNVADGHKKKSSMTYKQNSQLQRISFNLCKIKVTN